MGFHNDIVNVYLQVTGNLLLEILLHTPLEGSPRVAEVEGHGCVAEGTERADEGCGQWAQGIHGNLVVLGVRVQKAERLVVDG